MTGPVALERFTTSRSEDDGAAAPETGAPDGPLDDVDTAEAEQPETDPEAERAACLARVAGALEVIVAEQAGLRARCIGDASAALAAAAETLLPRLARAGFAALVAETARSIARRGQWPELELCVAPDDAAAVTGALGAFEPATEITISTDPSLGAGEAQLGWRDGGVEIDIEAITTAALDQFRRQLDGCAQQEGS